MFQSGQGKTLTDNTLMEIAAAGAAFNCKGLKFAIFQGDDAMLAADKIIETKHRKTFKFEVVDDPVGEFVGYLIADGKVHLDVLRMCCKLLNRSSGS